MANYKIFHYYNNNIVDSNKLYIEQFKLLKLPFTSKLLKVDKELELKEFLKFIKPKRKLTLTFNKNNGYKPKKGYNLDWAEPLEYNVFDSVTNKPHKKVFISKIFSVGKIELAKNVSSIIIKIIEPEFSSYKLLNLNSQYDLISVVDLFGYFSDYSNGYSDKILSVFAFSQMNKNNEIEIKFKNEFSKSKIINGKINIKGEFIQK